jgi:hypothetical protein
VSDLDELFGPYHGFRPDHEREDRDAIPEWALPVQRTGYKHKADVPPDIPTGDGAENSEPNEGPPQPRD